MNHCGKIAVTILIVGETGEIFEVRHRCAQISLRVGEQCNAATCLDEQSVESCRTFERGFGSTSFSHVAKSRDEMRDRAICGAYRPQQHAVPKRLTIFSIVNEFNVQRLRSRDRFANAVDI